MTNSQILDELESLHIHFEQGAKKCYRLRKKMLEQGERPNPAPSGMKADKAKVIEIINQRLMKIRNKSK